MATTYPINELQIAATPYDYSKPFFLFSDSTEFLDKAANSGAEEFELSIVDGSLAEIDLWNACQPCQAELDEWEQACGLETHEQAALAYACDVIGLSLRDALEHDRNGY